MRGPDPRPIHIAILHDGASLSISLTDGRSLARLGRVDAPVALIETAKRSAALAAVEARAEARGRRRKLGKLIFARLLPAPVSEFLAQCSPRPLYLQISPSLIAIPWEIAFDGEQFLGEKFPISRQILCEEELAAQPVRAARDVLKCLVVSDAGGSPRQRKYVETLLARMDTMPEFALRHLYAEELARDAALRSIGEADIVHYIGVVSGAQRWWRCGESIGLREITTLPHAPLLLVSEHCGQEQTEVREPDANDALAETASRAGLNVLVRDLPREDSLDLTLEFYRQLACGAPLAEALRHAIASVRRRGAGGTCLDAALYGDATLVLYAPTERTARRDDLRQATILSHDLVDSTRLLGALGAERYTELLARYHQRCASIVGRRGGVSDDPQGDDGIMCYFGVPVAREDSAVSSLRAGLEIVQAVAELGVSARVGIATGQVVVKAGQPVGMAIHLAARLQSIATPGTLVASDATHQLAWQQFEFERIGRPLELKGFDRPVTAYRVLGEAKGIDRFDTAPKLTAFVGRKRELRFIANQWAAARKGKVRIILISGEAGIGKSRLVREFRHKLALTSRETIESRCTPDHASSAFHPVIDFLRRLLRLQDQDSAERRLGRIESALASGIGVEGAVQLIAALLSIPFESRYAPLECSAERRRQLTLDVLVRWICREAGKTPLCLIVEDLQWIDPSSEEFLKRLIAAAAKLPLLVILTERSDMLPARCVGIKSRKLELDGLSSDAARAMICAVCGDASMPAQIVALLTEKADGVPLFIEESTRMAIELGAGCESGAAAPGLKFTVPATIHDLLMARLDWLSSAKPVAQLGAAIGREFSLPLLEAVLARESSPIKIDRLQTQLGILVNSGLLIEKGDAPSRSYFFRHALIRDAAYQSLWERDRKSAHRTIANSIAEKFPEIAQTQPELLAHHYAEAGMDAEALDYWEKAGQRAASRSAHAEAISHVNSGLALVARLAAAPERDRAELRMQLLLAGALIATAGYGAGQVGRVYARALGLCEAVDDKNAMMKVQLGLEGYHFMRADFAQAHAGAARAAAMITDSTDLARKLQSNWAIANILFHQGELAAAVGHMDTCLAAYHPELHRPRAVQDPGVMCLCYSAWGKWELGYPDQALERARRVVALAESLNHRFSMGEAYGFRTAVHHFRGENTQALRCAERAIEICESHGFAVWLAHARLMHGRIVAALGDAEAGISEMSRAYDMWAATGAIVTTPFYLALQAEGLALADRPEDGLVLLQRAYDIVCKYGERYYEAEIQRLLGELTLQAAARRGHDASDDAERWFRGALAFAHEKQLHSLALRSALSLARLCSAQGRAGEALQILQPEYEWFSEGLGTRDLHDARVLTETQSLVRASANRDRRACSKSPAGK